MAIFYHFWRRLNTLRTLFLQISLIFDLDTVKWKNQIEFQSLLHRSGRGCQPILPIVCNTNKWITLHTKFGWNWSLRYRISPNSGRCHAHCSINWTSFFAIPVVKFNAYSSVVQWVTALLVIFNSISLIWYIQGDSRHPDHIHLD